MTNVNLEPSPPSPGPAVPPTTIVFARSARARRYRLTLRRDGAAVAIVPVHGSLREAEKFVAAHADWLARARARQLRRPRPAAVFDMIYNPPLTSLLRDAGALGVPHANGLAMLVHQGARALELWTGATVPVGTMRAAAEAALVK